MHSITTVTRTVFTKYFILQNFTDLCEINCGFGPISEGQAFFETELVDIARGGIHLSKTSL